MEGLSSKISDMHLPSFAYSSTVFFSPTLNPSVVEAWRSSSPWLAMFIVKTGDVKGGVDVVVVCCCCCCCCC